MRKLVLWGHSVDAYQDMFDLSADDVNAKILEYACGPSAVNAQQSKLNKKVLSCDPLFVLDRDTLSSKVALIFADMVDEFKKQEHLFDFTHDGGLNKLVNERREGLKTFFADYERGKAEGRYLGLTDYHLPLADFSYDFALCSHYLFADLDNQTVDFHLAIIKELARVATEVRIFPLIDRDGQTSELLGPVMLALQQEKYGLEVREVDLHLYKSGNAMLRVWAQQCEV